MLILQKYKKTNSYGKIFKSLLDSTKYLPNLILKKKMTKLDNIHKFYKAVLTECGFDWILGYPTAHLKRQRTIFVILVGFLLLNTFQATISLGIFESFGVWAVCVILFCSASFSTMAAILLVIYGKPAKYLLDWCHNLYVAEMDVRFARIRDDLFKKCATQTMFLAKATFYGFKFLLIVIFVTPIPLYIFTGTVMLPATFYFPGLGYTEFRYYMLNYVSQFLGIFCATSVTPILNSILVMVLLHAKYQLDLIDASIELTINDAGKEKDTKIVLEEVIKMHADVLR